LVLYTHFWHYATARFVLSCINTENGNLREGRPIATKGFLKRKYNFKSSVAYSNFKRFYAKILKAPSFFIIGLGIEPQNVEIFIEKYIVILP